MFLVPEMSLPNIMDTVFRRSAKRTLATWGLFVWRGLVAGGGGVFIYSFLMDSVTS